MKTPEKIPAATQSAASANIAASEKRSVSSRFARRARARTAEKRDAEGFHEAGGGERRRQREQRADRRHQKLQAPFGKIGAQQNRLKGHPLGDEAVQRRQRRDRDAADEKSERGERHAMDQPAEIFHVARAARVLHRAGAEEQKALEHRMIEHVKDRRGRGERRRAREAVRLEGEREAKADIDDSDIFDRVIGEQPLQIVLHQRVEHAEHGRGAGEREHDHRPPGRGRTHQIEDDADEAVDRDLGHHAAHQRRDVARCRRVRGRQPSVQRHETGFRSRADDHEQKHEGGFERRERVRAHRIEEIISAARRHHAEGENQRQRADEGHDEIKRAGAAVFLLAVLDARPAPRRKAT